MAEAAAEAAELAAPARDDPVAADEAAREAELVMVPDMDEIDKVEAAAADGEAAIEAIELMADETAGADSPTAAAWNAAKDWDSVGFRANT